jgi:hypothetical protein
LRARRNRNKRLISESSTTIPAVTALISVVDHVPSVPVLLAEADGVQGPCERGIAESRKLGRTFVSLSHSFRVEYCVTLGVLKAAVVISRRRHYVKTNAPRRELPLIFRNNRHSMDAQGHSSVQ